MARTYRELEVFQLSADLRQMVLAMVANGPAVNDRKFCDQVSDAARSAPRNIAEGFGRYNPGEFVQFLDVACGSLDELDNHLRDGVEQRYFGARQAADAIRLCARCRWAAIGLRAYLRKEIRKRRSSQPARRRPPRNK